MEFDEKIVELVNVIVSLTTAELEQLNELLQQNGWAGIYQAGAEPDE